MITCPTDRLPGEEGFTGTLTQRAMRAGIIDFIRPFAQIEVQIAKNPHCLFTRLDLFRDLADLLHDLGIADEIVDKLVISGPKEPFTDGPLVWMGPGSGCFRAVIVRQERLKVRTSEVRSSINDDRLW